MRSSFSIKHNNLTFCLIFGLTLLILGCKNSRIKKLEAKEGRYIAKVVTSAGDHIDRMENDTLNFLTFPFNVAEFKGNRDSSKMVFIVGKSIDQGKNVSFIPIAKLTYNNGQDRVAIIARPTDPKLVTAPVDNYFDLISVHYGVQKMIETWLTYSRGFGSLNSIEWMNENQAIKYLAS